MRAGKRERDNKGSDMKFDQLLLLRSYCRALREKTTYNDL